MMLLKKADYGIDAPGTVRNFILIGVLASLAGVLLDRILRIGSPGLARACLYIGPFVGLSFLVTALVMVWGSKVGKLHLRDQLLGQIPWQGDELVLDVGCGRGLFLIGAAHQVPHGKVVGIDLWHSQDQSGNHPETTCTNARAEGVEERIELQTGDARQLPFDNDHFDRIVSSWAIHNIYDPDGRKQAMQEMVRVLKPGGWLAIADIEHTGEYEQVLRQAGLQRIQRRGPNFLFVTPTYTLIAQKPA
jgi:arsenite methyltransferase